jgi:hypothetical protein
MIRSLRSGKLRLARHEPRVEYATRYAISSAMRSLKKVGLVPTTFCTTQEELKPAGKEVKRGHAGLRRWGSSSRTQNTRSLRSAKHRPFPLIRRLLFPLPGPPLGVQIALASFCDEIIRFQEIDKRMVTFCISSDINDSTVADRLKRCYND